MNKQKPLIIDNRDNVKGLHTYCSKCKRLTTTRICGKTKKRLSSCKYPEFHKFKIIKAIPGTDSKKKRTKVLNTRDLNQAIKEKILFEKELEDNQYQKTSIFTDRETAKPTLLIECMAMYIGYLNNEGVELHMKKERSKGHIEDIERVFRYFCKSLIKNGIDHTIIDIYSVNDKVVALVHDYLLNDKCLANATYNKYMAAIRQFISWLIEIRDYKLKNPFKKVTRKAQVLNNETIEDYEFEKLLEVVKPENGIKVYSYGR